MPDWFQSQKGLQKKRWLNKRAGPGVFRITNATDRNLYDTTIAEDFYDLGRFCFEP